MRRDASKTMNEHHKKLHAQSGVKKCTRFHLQLRRAKRLDKCVTKCKRDVEAFEPPDLAIRLTCARYFGLQGWKDAIQGASQHLTIGEGSSIGELDCAGEQRPDSMLIGL